MTTPTLLLTPRRAALLADHDNTLDLLVRIQAPDLPAEQAPGRPPLNISLAIYDNRVETLVPTSRLTDREVPPRDPRRPGESR